MILGATLCVDVTGARTLVVDGVRAGRASTTGGAMPGAEREAVAGGSSRRVYCFTKRSLIHLTSTKKSMYGSRIGSRLETRITAFPPGETCGLKRSLVKW